MQKLLFRIFGLRIALLLGGICFFSVAVLGALFMTAGYSLEAYVSNQMNRLPWDVATLQQRSPGSYEQLRGDYRALEFVQKSEVLGVVRLQRDNRVVRVDVDGKLMPARWIVLLATTDPLILPPSLRSFEAGSAAQHGSGNRDEEKRIAVSAALLTASSATAAAADIGTGSEIRLYPVQGDLPVGHHHGTAHEHGRGPGMHVHETHVAETIFSAVVAAPPTQLRRHEFNKRMLANLGSLSFLPENSLVLSVPLSSYEHVVNKLDGLFVNLEGVHGGGVPTSPYLPELTHYVDLDNDQYLSSWDIGSSIRKLRSRLSTLSSLARDVSSASYVTSDAYDVLTRMDKVSRLTWLVTLLVAIPLIWLIWVVSGSLSGLFMSNERRLIGLVLIRGIPLKVIGSYLRLGLIVGCLVGGALGLVVGLGVPVLGYGLAGQPPPPWTYFAQGFAYFLVFWGVGFAVSLTAGQKIIRRIGRMTPREAMAWVTGRDSDEDNERPSVAYVVGALLALALGGYKVCAWIAGRSLIFPLLKGAISDSNLQMVMLGESLLNFIAVPLFLVGVMGVLRWRPVGFRHVLSVLSLPFVGRLHWFVAAHLKLSWHRIMRTVLLTSLAMSLALLPQVAADTFYDRVMRGVDMSLGGDLQLVYDPLQLTAGTGGAVSVKVHDELVRGRLSSIRADLEAAPGVLSVAELHEFVIPGFYLPGQSALALNLLRDTGAYLNTVRYEEQLGLTRPFSSIVRSLSGDVFASSSGFLKVRKVPLASDIIFGYSRDDTPQAAQLKEVVSFFPGQAGAAVTQREGYASAEADYLNHVMRSDARIFSTIDRFTESSLADLRVIPSRTTMLVRMENDVNDAAVDSLVDTMSIRPETIRWRENERGSVSEDMFVSLVLGNMNVFMIGGLILAIAGVYALSLASYRAEKRTLSLLRLRGLRLSQLLGMSMSMFLIPIVVGAALGVLLGVVSGYGISQAIWEMPRIHGVAAVLENQLEFSQTAWRVIVFFCASLTCVAVGFGYWSFRRTVRESIMER